MGPSTEFKKNFLVVGFFLLTIAVIAFCVMAILAR